MRRSSTGLRNQGCGRFDRVSTSIDIIVHRDCKSGFVNVTPCEKEPDSWISDAAKPYPICHPQGGSEPPLQKAHMTVVEIVAEEHTQLTHRYESKILRRRSIRLKRYDYKRIGAYFVTIATRNRESRFGDIIDGEVHLNDTGRLVKSRHPQGGSRTAPTKVGDANC